MSIPFERLVEEDLNLGTEIVSVTSPAGGTMTGHQITRRTFHPYSVHFFGAAGDGVSDDTPAIQRAINAASANGGGYVYFPNGAYRVTAEIAIKANGVKLLGESMLDAVLMWDDTANRGLNIDTAAADPISSALTVDAALGDRSVTVASGAGFTVGAWAFLDDGAANTTTLQTKIKSIAGNVVTLEDAMPGPLTVAASATLQSHFAHPLLTGIEIRKLTLRCATTTPAHLLTLCLMSRCDNFAIEDCVFNGTTGPLVTTRQTYQGHISHSTFTNALTVAGAAIENQTATGLLVTGNDVQMCQFGITFASALYCRTIGNRINGRQTSVALGRGIRYGESSNFGIVANNTVSDTNLYGIYFQDSSFCTCTGNTVSFTGSSTDTGEHGIQCGGLDAGNFCNHNTVSGNVIRGASGYGITIANQTNAQFTRHTITGNTISGCTWGAIFCTGSENTITANQCAAPGTTVIGALIRLTFGADYNTVVANTLTNEDTSGTTGINSAGGGGHNVFDDNIVTTPLYIPQNTYAATDSIGATEAFVTTALPRTPMVTTTEVGTDADLLEKTAWTITVPANVMSAATHALQIDAAIVVAANNNAKTVRFKIGGNTFTGDCGAAFDAQQYTLQMRALVVWTSATSAKVWVFWLSTHVSTARNMPGGTCGSVAGIDFTVGFNITVTLQNGTASANDLKLQMGLAQYVGVPQGS